MFKILTLNNLSVSGLRRLPRERYEVASEIQHPDGILVRSFNMHEMDIPPTLKAVGRAGAGVNNIPVDKMSARGIVVFNAPGANSNAVKELVIAGMLLAARNIVQAWDFARGLEGTDVEIRKAAEAGKKQFVGWELPGRTLGVIGLGEVGVQVANAAEALGMKVLGYDPAITIRHAWQLSSHVTRAASIDEVFRRADVLTVHVPLIEATQGLVNAERLALMKQRALVLNFSRAGIVDSPAMVAALESGSIRGYVCDFPSAELLNRPKVVALPHLGASTVEAEENSAAMAVNELRDFLENGNISNSVNFPDAVLAREPDTTRIVVANVNVPNMVAEISALIGDAGINITNLLNKSRGELAWTMIDVRGPVTDALRSSIEQIEGVLRVRVIEP